MFLANYSLTYTNNRISQVSSPNQKYIVVGIDGTGSTEWMKPDGSNSHTFRFVKEFKYGTYGVDRKWFHGPSDTTMGKQTEPILQEALSFVVNRLHSLFPNIKQTQKPFEMFDVNTCQQTNYYSNQARNGYGGYYAPSQLRQIRTVSDVMKTGHQALSMNDVRVVIIGHSRGGLAATVLAKMLSPLVKVYFLGLYDSVDRQPCLDGQTVENVHVVYHARRSPDMNSRWYFGNTSVQYKTDLPAREEFFETTHGGIGGDYIDDPRKVGFGTDTTCVPYGKEMIVTADGNMVEIDRTHPVAKKKGRPINQICEEGKRGADRFIREGARRFGLPIN